MIDRSAKSSPVWLLLLVQRSSLEPQQQLLLMLQRQQTQQLRWLIGYFLELPPQPGPLHSQQMPQRQQQMPQRSNYYLPLHLQRS